MRTYAQAEREMTEIISTLLVNQTFCKLIYYDVPNPLSQPDIIDTSKLLYTSKDIGKETLAHRIFGLPKMPDVTSEAKTIIIPRLISSKPLADRSNVYYKNYTILFNIATHEKLWNLDGGGTRVLQILDQFDKVFNLKDTQNSSSKMLDKGATYQVLNEKWLGYIISYELTGSSIACRGDI